MTGWWFKFRDNAMTWPLLKVTFYVLPWTWRLHWYYDSEPAQVDRFDPRESVAGNFHVVAQVGPIEVDYGHNRPAFVWEDADADAT